MRAGAAAGPSIEGRTGFVSSLRSSDSCDRIVEALPPSARSARWPRSNDVLRCRWTLGSDGRHNHFSAPAKRPMNAPDRIQSIKPTFKWDDPLLLDEQLSEEERMVRETARAYAQEKLFPRITQAFRHE